MLPPARSYASLMRPAAMCTPVVRASGRLAAAAAAMMMTVVIAACGGTHPQSDVITMTADTCGGIWQVSGPGWHTFQLMNGNDVGGEVDLTDPSTGGIYAEVSGFGPQTTTHMALDLGSGKYAFRCLFEDADPVAGPTVTISGHASGTPATLPMPFYDLVRPAAAYQAYVGTGLTTLSRLVATLAGDIGRGDLNAARRDWLPAHLEYERLGAAYDAFGAFDDEIDGRADALGVSSPQWTGFYRLEYGLWRGQSAAELTPVADTLLSDVKALLASWPHQEIALLDLGLRTHEILENALEFQLSGHDDYGSGSTLATTLANVDGTRELLSLLHPLLVPRYAALPAVSTSLDRLQAALEREHRPDGTWVPVSGLTTSARQQIDAACDQALTELAPIASITEPRN